MKAVRQNLGLDILACHMVEMRDSWHHPNLSAPFWRLYWNDRRGACVVLDGKRTDLVPERFMLIPPDTPYAGEQVNRVKHFYLHFTLKSVHTAGPRLYIFAAHPLLAGMVERICDICRNTQSDRVRSTALALALAHFAVAQVPQDAFQESYSDRRVEETIRLMQRSVGDALPNPVLAKRTGMNTNAFIRLFRETTDRTPQEYFARLRIEKACAFLHHSDQSLDDIAAMTGFCDRYHFSRVFKKWRGMGPAAFRRLVMP